MAALKRQAQLRVLIATLWLSPGDTEDTDTRDRIRIRIRSRNKLKLHLPEGYGMSATSTTDLEPLSDHGTWYCSAGAALARALAT